jgi:hypothetical protein
MRLLGLLLLFLGIASSLVQSMAPEMRFQAWINDLGDGTAWGIRGGCCALGGLLLMVTKRKPKQ